MKVGEVLGRVGIAATCVTVMIIAGALSPLVSVVALPIFAAKAIPKWIEHRSLYKKTLTNDSREKYGRIAGQDYTRWDGKKVVQVNIDPKEVRKARMHEAIDEYIHGGETTPGYHRLFTKQAEDSPFQTSEDLEWLNKEYTRREKKDLLDADLKMLRAFAKAMIPFIGVFWVLGSEIRPGGASEMGCRVCSMGGDESAHWGWRSAISYHQNFIEGKLRTAAAVQTS